MIILNFTKSFIRRTAPKQNMEDDSGYDTINKGDITHITWEWVQYLVDDIIGDNEEEDQYHIIISYIYSPTVLDSSLKQGEG